MTNIINRIISFFFGERSATPAVAKTEDTLDTIAARELDAIWAKIRACKEDGLSDTECIQSIAESFTSLKERFPAGQLEKAYIWPRYVKASVCCGESINQALVDYVSSENYVYLSDSLKRLSHSLCKDDKKGHGQRMERFSEAVYLHIVNDIDPHDGPACLALGKIAQRNGEYETARKWFEKALESDTPFNGLTSLLACYEAEVKSLIKKRDGDPETKREEIRILNKAQLELYEEWHQHFQNALFECDDLPEETKVDYVRLTANYSRFQRMRGHYQEAYELLNEIPRTYPEIYRAYTEEAMLYQCKPEYNRFFSIEHAIETFKKANNACTKDTEIRARKAILMPLANTYFMAGQFDGARETCKRVLALDKKERRAYDLMARISALAS